MTLSRSASYVDVTGQNLRYGCTL